MRWLLRALFGLRRLLRGAPQGAAARGAAARGAARTDLDPWVAATLAALGDRYQAGEAGPDGIRVLRRTGRARFNPMPIWLDAKDRRVTGDYEVRAHGAQPVEEARAILETRVTGALAALGLAPAEERIEEWGGVVLVRRYRGICQDPGRAATAVSFMCVESEQLIDTAAE